MNGASHCVRTTMSPYQSLARQSGTATSAIACNMCDQMANVMMFAWVLRTTISGSWS
jgi:hypothetical protein